MSNKNRQRHDRLTVDSQSVNFGSVGQYQPMGMRSGSSSGVPGRAFRDSNSPLRSSGAKMTSGFGVRSSSAHGPMFETGNKTAAYRVAP